MTTRVQKKVYTAISTFALLVFVSGCVIHVGSNKSHAAYIKDYTSVNKSVYVSANQTVDKISSVNGTITVESDVEAYEISTVNGTIELGSNVKVDEISSVNGTITTDSGLVVANTISTVNGTVNLNEQSTITGTVRSVNGEINAEKSFIEGNIETVNGNISLTENCEVKGDIVYKWSNKSKRYKGKPPVLVIDSTSTVDGKIILERPVTLKIKNKDLIDKVEERF